MKPHACDIQLHFLKMYSKENVFFLHVLMAFFLMMEYVYCQLDGPNIARHFCYTNVRVGV